MRNGGRREMKKKRKDQAAPQTSDSLEYLEEQEYYDGDLYYDEEYDGE